MLDLFLRCTNESLCLGSRVVYLEIRVDFLEVNSKSIYKLISRNETKWTSSFKGLGPHFLCCFYNPT